MKRIVRELAPSETRLAHAALAALRPTFADAERFTAYVDDVLRPEGYRLGAVLVPGARDAVAAAGFRTGHSLAWGHYLYVDDISTLPEHRARGHARELLRWILKQADRLECDQLHLDSGTGPDRFAAHRLYYVEGLVISAHHFGVRVPPSTRQDGT